MSMTQQIRDALASGPKNLAELHAVIGGDDNKIKALLGYMKDRAKEVKVDSEDADGVKTFALRSGGGSAAPRASKKPARKKAKAMKRKRAKPIRHSPSALRHREARHPYRALAEKHTNGNGAALHALALDNLVHAGILLREAIGDTPLEDQVPGLASAIALYDRAAQIHQAAKQPTT